MGHVLHVHHAVSQLAILLGLHHIHGPLSSEHVGIHLLHLTHVDLRVVAMEDWALASEVGHCHSIRHLASRRWCS